MNNSLGRHWIIEFYDCCPDKLSQPDFIENTLQATARVIGATIVQSNFHHFSPLGVSGVVVIQESHLTIHTWPEYGYAAVDIFTCGEMDINSGVNLLMANLEAGKKEEKLLHRGFVFLGNKKMLTDN